MCVLTVSMRVMSAGHGYRYLLTSVAIADRDRGLSTPLADYYTAQGTPPGRWLGSGVAGLSDGWISPEDVVTEEQLRLLLGEGKNPVTGLALGRAFPVYRSQKERIQARVARLDASLSTEDRARAVEQITTEEVARKSKRAVAGFDFTFSAPKSVSVLWALVDPATRAAIIAAHHAAVADVIDLMEREFAATRMGATGPDGVIGQVAVDGLIATAFDHYDSRSGDPQLHTHVVIANKARTTVDGTWRSLDGRPLHAAVVAMSEHYNAVLADRLTCDLGVVWQSRRRGADRNPQWEIASVPQRLLDTFSSRSRSIDTAKGADVPFNDFKPEFNQGTVGAKRAAETGPVYITDRGKPAHVLLTNESYIELIGQNASIVDLLTRTSGIGAIDFDPPKMAFTAQPTDLST